VGQHPRGVVGPVEGARVDDTGGARESLREPGGSAMELAELRRPAGDLRLQGGEERRRRGLRGVATTSTDALEYEPVRSELRGLPPQAVEDLVARRLELELEERRGRGHVGGQPLLVVRALLVPRVDRAAQVQVRDVAIHLALHLLARPEGGPQRGSRRHDSPSQILQPVDGLPHLGSSLALDLRRHEVETGEVDVSGARVGTGDPRRGRQRQDEPAVAAGCHLVDFIRGRRARGVPRVAPHGAATHGRPR
jgi:hypothetical protein